ncbi:MAG: N-acetylmuramic acid 6-phosphate etherase, partial [Plesiomonas shigelloides]
VKPAILMHLTGLNAEQAIARLAQHQGYLRHALQA